MLIEGRVTYEDDSPAGDVWVNGVYNDTNGMTHSCGNGRTEADGFYSLALPTGRTYAVRAGGDPSTWYPKRYYSNAYAIPDATPITGIARSTTNIDFVLYGHDQDSDADGLMDHQEDSRPDGIYVPGEDSSSHINSDTDGDSHTDYEEVELLHTDPTNQLSNLSCVGVGPDGFGGLRVTWSSAPGHGQYWIETCPTLVAPTPQWVAVAGPFWGSASNTSSTVLGVPTDTNAFYRIKVVR